MATRVVAALVVLIGLLTSVVPADAEPTADEAEFIALINELRASRGVPALSIDPELMDNASQWTQEMAESGYLHHASDLSIGITSDWVLLGENVGFHAIYDIPQLFDAFVASPSHLRNLVDPRFTHIGVGVIVQPNGHTWTTHRFMGVNSAPATTLPPTTTPSTSTTSTPTTTVATTVAPTPTTPQPTIPESTTSESTTSRPPAPSPTTTSVASTPPSIKSTPSSTTPVSALPVTGTTFPSTTTQAPTSPPSTIVVDTVDPFTGPIDPDDPSTYMVSGLDLRSAAATLKALEDVGI